MTTILLVVPPTDKLFFSLPFFQGAMGRVAFFLLFKRPFFYKAAFGCLRRLLLRSTQVAVVVVVVVVVARLFFKTLHTRKKSYQMQNLVL